MFLKFKPMLPIRCTL